MKSSSINLRFFALGAILLITLTSSVLLVPRRAQAQAAGAGCAGLLTARITGTATGAAAGAAAGAASFTTGPGFLVHDSSNVATQIAVSHGQGTQDLVKCMLDSLAWTVAKVAIQSITRSTVNWINSGFSGSPAFVTNLQSNLSTLSDTVANNFFQQLNRATTVATAGVTSSTGFNLTSPFQDQITNQLRQDYYQTTGSLLGLNQYNLNQSSQNPQAFIHNNFGQGGFNAFFSVSQNPANNPFDAYMTASNALWNQLDANIAQRKSELDWGKGFLPWRGSNCSPPTSSNTISNTVTGSVNGQTVASNTTVIPVVQGGGTITNTVTGTVNGTVVASDTKVIPLAKTEGCVGSPIKTPGSVVESQLEGVLGTGIRQLELANSVNEIVGALAGQLVNQVLGAGGLLGVSNPASGGGSSYLNQATSPSQYTGSASSAGGTSLSDGVTQTISNDIASLTSYRDNWQKILDAANAAQAACGTGNTTVAAVVTQATAGVASANTSLRKESAISKSIQDTASSAAIDSGTKITTALTQYTSFLASATTPQSDDIAYIAAQSTAGNDPSGTPTLYTQMMSAKNSCVTHT